MLTKENVKYYAFPVFFILMLLDAQVTRLIETGTHDVYIANAHLFLLALMCGCRTLPKRFMLITGLILGALFDVYYIGVLGIYAVSLPLMIWAMYGLYNVLYRSIYTMFFGMIIFVTTFEMVNLGIQLLFNLADVNSTYFVTRFLGPTLLLNLILFVIFVIPFKKLFPTE